MRIGRLLLVLTTLAFVFGLLSTSVSAQQSSDVRLDSAVRSLEMGPRETRTDLTVDLYNTTSERRGCQDRARRHPGRLGHRRLGPLLRLQVGEIVVEPPAARRHRASQSLRLRVDLPDERPPAGTYRFGLRITSPDGSIEYDSARYTIIVPEPPAPPTPECPSP